MSTHSDESQLMHVVKFVSKTIKVLLNYKLRTRITKENGCSTHKTCGFTVLRQLNQLIENNLEIGFLILNYKEFVCTAYMHYPVKNAIYAFNLRLFEIY